MIEAFVLLKISHTTDAYGFARSVVDKLRTIPNVEEAELLFGDYDAIVKLKGDKMHDIENLIIEKISTVDGVISNVTLICVDEKTMEE
jgi:DNA-binding Lrp family transcriptional regulator